MSFAPGFAYPSSTWAAQCGRGEAGCFIVTRSHNARNGKPLLSPALATTTPFKTEAEAQGWADAANEKANA